MAEKLKGIQDLFSLLSRSAADLNSLFSVPVLYLVTTRVITTTICLFILIFQFFIPAEKLPSNYGRLNYYLICSVALPSVVFVAVILTAADSPVQEVLICINFAFFQTKYLELIS